MSKNEEEDVFDNMDIEDKFAFGGQKLNMRKTKKWIPEIEKQKAIEKI